MSRRLLSGIAASKGIGVGRCLVIRNVEEPERREDDQKEARGAATGDEVKSFESAVRRVERDLRQIELSAEAEAGTDAAAVLEAQILILKDPLFVDEVTKLINTGNLTAEAAIAQSVTYLKERFASLSTKYVQERGEDITEIGARLINTLRGKREDLDSIEKEAESKRGRVILVSASLGAATVARFGRKLLAGIVAEAGSTTSHLAIVAGSLGIPAVLGVKDVAEHLRDGDLVMIDGGRGQVIVNPTADELRERQKQTKPWTAKTILSPEPTETIDGHRIQVSANVADLQSTQQALASGAEGIGLFRTEFLYLDRDTLPNEDELYQVMKECVSLTKGRPIIIRTLDVGGDKKPGYMVFPKEANPALGLRGIRFSLKSPVQLLAQLSAILRASVEGNVSIMFPMVSTVKELADARQMVDEAKRRLRDKGDSFNENLGVGIMVETPSAALMTEKLADEADFFSIGTNDLVQYTLAVDRENLSVAALGDPLEPSVLKLIQQMVNSAHSKKRHVSVCGEMAADLEAVPILVGLGLDELSVAPSNIQNVKKMVRSISFTEAEKCATKALSMSSASEVRELSSKMFQTNLV